MNASDGSSKTEKTETKPDGSIVRTIVEIKGNQKKNNSYYYKRWFNSNKY